MLSHGNGPQVGLLALQAAAYKDVEAYPLDVLGAQTEGMIGYMVEQELGNLLPAEVPVRHASSRWSRSTATTRPSPTRPSSSAPSTTRRPAEALAAEKGWAFKPDGAALPPGRAVAGAEAHLRDPPHPLAARARARS